MIPRLLEELILRHLHLEKIIIVYGARQVGKTTLVHSLLKRIGKPYLLLNGDEPDVREMLSGPTSTQMKALIGDRPILVIDEAQRIPNIGMTLKLVHDTFPRLKIIVTGSSSLEISSQLQEPLTGRKLVYKLFPISFKEMVNTTTLLEEKRLLEHRLIYGYYPEIVTRPGYEETLLYSLTESYLFKDILAMGMVKKPVILDKLIRALALQIGKEVSYHEIGQLIGADSQTVERYIDLLEKAFIVFQLPPFSRNLRNEIKKMRKVYFVDNGIRNAVIKNFNPMHLRQDVGEMWENFIISERIKFLHYQGIHANYYFWRTRNKQEIDFIEEYGGQLHAYEMKWNPRKKVRFPQSFLSTYHPVSLKVIHRENFSEFLL